jgi:hypothetical protein
MRGEFILGKAFVASLFVAVSSAPAAVSAITLEVARKCNALATKEFPPREVGNPAAGSSKGTAQAQRDFFAKCVANGGSVDKPADNGAPASTNAK